MSHELSRDPILRDIVEIEGYKVLGPCVLSSKIGQGGMGAVYRGQHVNLEIEVAVKCLLPALMTMDGDLVTRFHREAQLAARVTHQNLVRVYDFGEQSDLHYLIMEYVTGESLRQRVDRAGACTPADAVTIILQAAEGLAAAHEEEIVHRDIKPDNILVSDKGLVKVADLGLGRIGHGQRDMTMSRVPMGTPTYMPPEQWKAIGSVGPEGDVWALGATLYYLLAGESAFKGASMQEVQQQICEAPFPQDELSDIPSDVLGVLCRSTQRRPEDRYPSARELADALEDVAAEHGFDGDLKSVVGNTVFLDDSSAPGSVPRPPPSVIERVKGELTPTRASFRASVAVTERLPSSARKWGVWAAGIGVAIALGLGAFLTFDWLTTQFESLKAPAGSGGPAGTASVPKPTHLEIPGFRFEGTNERMFDEYVHEKSNIRMVLLPEGTFEMGSPGEDLDADEDERPRHLVRLSRFLIAKYEVSQEEWRRTMGKDRVQKDDIDRGDTFPVFNVSWDDCQDFCSNTGLLLPTEAQWEFACRSQTRTRFAFGASLGELDANFYTEIGRPTLLAVDAKAPNRFGLYNMHGNVAEWCRDDYHETCYREKKDQLDPVCGPGEEDSRVYRGGNFETLMLECRSSRRWSEEPDFADRTIGFRPVFEWNGRG